MRIRSDFFHPDRRICLKFILPGEHSAPLLHQPRSLLCHCEAVRLPPLHEHSVTCSFAFHFRMLLGLAQDERLLVLGQVCSCHDLCGLDVPHSHFICTNTSWMVSQIIRIKLNVYVVGIMLKIVQKWCLVSLWNNFQRQLTVLVTKWVAKVSFVLPVMHAW